MVDGTKTTYAILYIKANMVVSVCGDKQGRGRAEAGQGDQGSCCRGPGEVPFLLKKSLGKTGGPASNQTKIQIF